MVSHQITDWQRFI